MEITLTKPEGSTVILQIVAAVGPGGEEEEVDYRIDGAHLVGDHTSHGYRLEAIHPTGIENLLHFSRYKFQGHTSVSVECWTKSNIKEKSIERTFTFHRNMKLFPEFCRLRMYLIEADNDNEGRDEEDKTYDLPWIKGEKQDEEEQRNFEETYNLAPEVTKAPELSHQISKARKDRKIQNIASALTALQIGKTEQMERMITAVSKEGKTIAHTKLDDEGNLETDNNSTCRRVRRGQEVFTRIG